MIDASAIGSSRNAVTSGTRSSSMCGSRISSWWLVPRRSATMRAQLDSSNEGSEKPIEKLFTLPGVSSAMVAATALESIPPERKTPIGTSATSSLRTASLRAARRLPAQDMTRRQLVDAPQDRSRCGDVLEREVLRDRPRIDVAWHGRVGQKGFELRAKHQVRADLGVVEGLDPDTVAGQDQYAAPDIPDRKGEHAVEVAEEAVAPLFIGVQHALGVGVRRHRVAEPDQLRSKLGVVVDLPVEDDPQRAVLIADRLVAAGEVDDRQPPATERDALANARSFVVGPSMRDARAHPVEHFRNGPGIGRAGETANPTHA